MYYKLSEANLYDEISSVLRAGYYQLDLADITLSCEWVDSVAAPRGPSDTTHFPLSCSQPQF
jgi:hypothetical protein